MASIRSFLGATCFTFLGLTAIGCSSAPEDRGEAAGSTAEAFGGCPAGEVRVAYPGEGLGGKTLYACEPIDNPPPPPPPPPPVAGGDYWTFIQGYTSANTRGFTAYPSPPPGPMQTMTSKGCSAPIDVDGQAVFVCPTTAPFSDVLHWFTDENGVPLPTCQKDVYGWPYPPSNPLDKCETIATFANAGDPSLGVPFANYGFVVAESLGQGPVSMACPNGCPISIIGGGSVKFYP